MPSEENSKRRLIAGRSVRWNEALAARAYAQGLWVRETLADAIRDLAVRTPDRLLLIDGERRIDCHTLYAQATALASALLQRFPAGSVVSFMLPNWHEAATIYLAATLAGMVVNPILPSLRERELQFILTDVGSRLVFVPASFRQQDYVAMLGRATAAMEQLPEIVVLRGAPRAHTPYESLLASAGAVGPFPTIDADGVRMILYTSGTTGRPKGVLHSHNSLHALIRQMREHWLIESGDRFLVPSPLGHIGGSVYAFECSLLLGTTAILMDRWNPSEAVQLIESQGCTHMAGATPFLEQMLSAAQAAGTRLPSLKVFICGGASVPPSLIRRGAQHFAQAVVTRVYGSTEVPVMTVGALRRDDVNHAAETDGQPAFAEIRLSGHDAAPSGDGEICARGPQMLVGYLHPQDEADAFDGDGFFRTGDLGRWADGSYLVVTGRAKDIVIRKGENISPKEIEDILGGHPEIAEIAIVGLPDPRTGERACAVIVPRRAPGPDVASLREYLDAQGVAPFKAPEQVVIWDSLPKNDAGKVLKHKIKAALE